MTAALQKDAEKKAAFGIPENFTPLAALAVGYSTEEVAVCKEFAPKFEITRV